MSASGTAVIIARFDYRTKAAESLRRALRATSITDKGRLLAMAEGWLEMADRVQKVADPPMQDMAEAADE